jgi:hypothetical protein
VELVQVDVVAAEALEAALQLEADRGRPQVVDDRASLAGVPAAAAFGEHQHALAPLADHLADDLLRVAEAIDGGGVDPVDPGVEGPVHGSDGLVVVLGSPAEGPRATDRPRTDADRGDARAVAAEVAELHAVLPPMTGGATAC